MHIRTMLSELLHTLLYESQTVRTVVLLLMGGIATWAYHTVLRIARRLFQRFLLRFAAPLSQPAVPEPEHSSTSGAASSSPLQRTPKRAPATWSYSDAMAAGISGSLSESQKMDVLNAWKQTRQAGSVVVSGTATGCGDVCVHYTNRGQRSGSLTSFGPEREN